MPTLEEGWEEYRVRSAKTSDIARHLAFGGLGVVWLFSESTPGGLAGISQNLFTGMALLVFSLAFDLLHAVTSVVSLGIYFRILELHGAQPSENILLPRALIRPVTWLWAAKLLALALAYVFLLLGLLQRIR